MIRTIRGLWADEEFQHLAGLLFAYATAMLGITLGVLSMMAH